MSIQQIAAPLSLESVHRRRVLIFQESASSERARARAASVHRRKRDRDRRQVESRRVALVAKTPPKPASPPNTTVSLETLKHLDDAYNAIFGLMKSGAEFEVDRLARPLLESLLRLAWAKTSGKPKCNPAPASIPHKLFQWGAIDRDGMKELESLIASPKTHETLSGCKKLLVWVSAADRRDKPACSPILSMEGVKHGS